MSTPDPTDDAVRELLVLMPRLVGRAKNYYDRPNNCARSTWPPGICPCWLCSSTVR